MSRLFSSVGWASPSLSRKAGELKLLMLYLSLVSSAGEDKLILAGGAGAARAVSGISNSAKEGGESTKRSPSE